jgi:hypothetical protein
MHSLLRVFINEIKSILHQKKVNMSSNNDEQHQMVLKQNSDANIDEYLLSTIKDRR